MMTMQLSSHLRQLGASHTAVGYIGKNYLHGVTFCFVISDISQRFIVNLFEFIR